MTLLGQHLSFSLAVYPRSSHISDCLSITSLCCQNSDLAGAHEESGNDQLPFSNLTSALTAFMSVGYGSFPWLL